MYVQASGHSTAELAACAPVAQREIAAAFVHMVMHSQLTAVVATCSAVAKRVLVAAHAQMVPSS